MQATTRFSIVTPKRHLVNSLYWQLPEQLRQVTDKEEISFILGKKQEYYSKSMEREINITAFMGLEQYISREAKHFGMPLSNQLIRIVVGM